MLGHFRLLAGHNAWANRRLTEAAESLSDAEWRADRGVFFRSIEGTLSHLLLADRVWMHRFTGEGVPPDRTDALPFPDRAAFTHFFNHQTLHRGQAHAVLTGLGHSGPELDLLYFERLQATASG